MNHSDVRIVGISGRDLISGIGSVMSCDHFFDFGSIIFYFLSQTNFLSFFCTFFFIWAGTTATGSALWAMFSFNNWLILNILGSCRCGGNVMRIGWCVSSVNACAQSCSSKACCAIAGTSSETCGPNALCSKTSCAVAGSCAETSWSNSCSWWWLVYICIWAYVWACVLVLTHVVE